MIAVNLPRDAVYRGHVLATALYFDDALYGESAAQRRVLDHWAPGARVWRVAQGYAIRLASSRRVRCDEAIGAPLVERDGVLYGLPLEDADRKALAAPAGSLVLARGGAVQVFAPAAFEEVAPETWLDVSAFSAAEVKTLAAPPPPVPLATRPIDTPVRELFGPTVPAASAEQQEFLASLQGGTASGGATRAAAARGSSVLAKIGGWLAGVIGGLRARASSGGAAGSGRAEKARPSGSSALAKPQPRSALGRAFDRFADALEKLLLRALVASRLSDVLGKRQSEYVQKMLELFESGNFDEALRHAIPLDGPIAERARIMLGTPTPRSSLEIRPAAGSVGSVMVGGASLIDELRRRYRAAFEALVRADRIEEAAFVLTELLHANDEAVTFLEKHGRLKLAAEIAEARNLPPALVIRQWMRAKDVARAIAVARRTGAFADAVLRLEATGHLEEARVLRLLWGELLAQSGDYARAVDAVWPLKQARALAKQWIEAGIELGGSASAALLVRRGLVSPERDADTRTRIEAMIASAQGTNAVELESFASELVRSLSPPPGSVLRKAAKPVARAWLRSSAGVDASFRNAIRALMALSDDSAALEDLPTSLRPSTSLRERAEPLKLELPESASASPAITDAVLLPRRRVLVALGESGVELWDANGHVLRRFDVPAGALVASDLGNRVLAIARRGNVRRVSRIELDSGRASHWCDLRFGAFAPTWDGATFFVAQGASVLELDALSSPPRALWQVDRVFENSGGHVSRLHRTPHELHVLVRDFKITANAPPEDYTEHWIYEWPRRVLRQRKQIDSSTEDGFLMECEPVSGTAPVVVRAQRALTTQQWTLKAGAIKGGTFTLDVNHLMKIVRCAPPGWIAHALERARGATFILLEGANLTPRAQIETRSAATARFFGGELAVWTAEGRILRLSLKDGTHHLYPPRR